MANTISTYLNIFCGGLIILGMFWGLVRGLKKTTSRLIFLLVTGVLLLFLTTPITNLLLKIPFKAEFVSDLGVSTSGTITILEFITLSMENFLGQEFITKYPEFSQVVIALPLTLIYIVIFEVLFWLLKYLLYPVNGIITKIFFNDKKKKNKVSKKDKKNNPEQFIDNQDEFKVDKSLSRKERKLQKKAFKKANKPKRRHLLGSLVGALVGVVLIFYTMIPIYGAMNILSKHKDLKLNNIYEETISVEELTGGILDDIVKGYDLSVIGRISNSIGLEKLGVASFDKLTSVKVNDTKIVLREDVDVIVTTFVKVDKLYGSINTISSKGIKNITEEELTTAISSVEDLLNTCSQIKFISSLEDYILPITYEILIKNDVQLVENEQVNKLLIEMIADLVEKSGLDVIGNLQSLVDVAKFLNEEKILHPLVTSNYTTLLTNISNSKNNFSSEFSNKIMSIGLIDSLIPNILNIGLTILDNSLEFGYVENTATETEIKNSFTQLISNLVDTARVLDYNSKTYVTDNSLISIGKLLDTFRNSKLFHIDTYNNLVDLGVEKIKNLTTDLLPTNLQNVLTNQIINNISKVSNWTNEMTSIYNTLTILRDKEFGVLGDVVEGSDLREGYSFKVELNEGTLINIGKALDEIEKSTLLQTNYDTTINGSTYTNTTAISLFSALLDELYASVAGDEPSEDSMFDIINVMKENLIKSNHKSPDTFWKDELTAVSPLIEQILNILDSSELTITEELGIALDKCSYNNSIMLGNDTTLILMEKLMSTIQDQICGEDYTPLNDGSLTDSIYTLLVDIRNNLKSEQLYNELKADNEFWKKEITCILALKEIAEDANNVTDITSAKLLAPNLDKAYTSKIIPDLSLNKTIASVLKQLKTDDSTGINGKINSLIDNISSDITNETLWKSLDKTNFWTIEFNYINKLTDIKFEDNGDYKVLDNLSSIGETIDNIISGQSELRASYFITENRIRDILSSVVSEMTSSIEDNLNGAITNAINKISKNIYNSDVTTQVEINSFETELGHIGTLANLEISSDLFSYNDETIDELEEKLSELGSSLDSISYNTSTSNNITSYNEELNSKIITRDIIADIISAGFDTAKVNKDESLMSTIEKSFNSLINNVQNNISTIIVTSDKVISWSRELTYVSTLIKMNSGESYTLDNASSTIGANIDRIAFNHSTTAFNDVVYDGKNIVGNYLVSTTIGSDTIYYNSVLITREMLKATMNSLISDFKVTETSSEDEIANELINNLSTKVSTTFSSTLYNDYKTAFTELNEVKETMEDMSSDFESISIDTLDDNTINEIDQSLNTIESKVICGETTTRNIVVMIIEKFKTTSATDTKDEILNEIIDNSINKINNNYYNEYKDIFNDLRTVQSYMTDMTDVIDGKSEILDFSEDELIEIDKTLSKLQSNAISGENTTRKIALMIVDNIIDITDANILNNTEAGTYILDLQNHYKTSTTTEVYYSESSSDTYANPMATIYEKLESIIPTP